MDIVTQLIHRIPNIKECTGEKQGIGNIVKRKSIAEAKPPILGGDGQGRKLIEVVDKAEQLKLVGVREIAILYVEVEGAIVHQRGNNVIRDITILLGDGKGDGGNIGVTPYPLVDFYAIDFPSLKPSTKAFDNLFSFHFNFSFNLAAKRLQREFLFFCTSHRQKPAF